MVARREASLQHGCNPGDRGRRREAAESRAEESGHRANANREPSEGHFCTLRHSHFTAGPAQGRGLRTAEGTLLPENTRAELRRHLARLRVVREQIRAVEQERRRNLATPVAKKGSHA